MIVVPIGANVGCGLVRDNNVLQELVLNKNNFDKNFFEKAREKKKSFDKIYGKCLQDGETDQKENQALCEVFLRTSEDQK